MDYFAAIHKDEDQNAMIGEPLDSANEHMVFHKSYDRESLRELVRVQKHLVLWRLTRKGDKYVFTDLVGIPH